MNQLNDPDNITYKEARQTFKFLAPLILIGNLTAAVLIFVFSHAIFLEEKMFLGTLLAGAFVLTGVISFFIMNAMGKRVTQTEIKHPEKHED